MAGRETSMTPAMAPDAEPDGGAHEGGAHDGGSHGRVHGALTLSGVTRRYAQGAGALEILRGIDLKVAHGQSVALVAPSGTGKSTLLHIAGLLEHSDEGEVFLDGIATARLPDKERTKLRRLNIGFVYQFHHLLGEFTALENVAMPQMIRGFSHAQANARARELLTYLGLAARLEHRPSELSGGEQQRVAIARALANAPRLLLADEPTGNLDPKTSDHVFNAMTELVRATGVAAVIATHNLELASRMDRRVTLREGKVVELA